MRWRHRMKRIKGADPCVGIPTDAAPSWPADVQRTRARLRALAWWLDNSIRLPGGFRIGADAILGLVPFLGDVLGMLLSGYIMLQAVRLRAPSSVLAHMALNIALEVLIGVVPLAGDLFDAAWKANLRNLGLLERYLDQPAITRSHSQRLFAWLTLGAVLLMAVVTLLAAYLLTYLLIRAW